MEDRPTIPRGKAATRGGTSTLPPRADRQGAPQYRPLEGNHIPLCMPTPTLPAALIDLMCLPGAQRPPPPPSPPTVSPASPEPPHPPTTVVQLPAAVDWQAMAVAAEAHNQQLQQKLSLLQSAADKYDPEEATSFSRRSGFSATETRRLVQATTDGLVSQYGERPGVNVFFQSGSIHNTTNIHSGQQDQKVNASQEHQKYRWSAQQTQVQQVLAYDRPAAAPTSYPMIEYPQEHYHPGQQKPKEQHGRSRYRGRRGADKRPPYVRPKKESEHHDFNTWQYQQRDYDY